MNNFKKLSLTLALLITAVTGAWAQDVDYDIYVDFDNHYNPYETPFNCIITNLLDYEAEVKGTLDLSVDGDLKGSFNVDGKRVHVFIKPAFDAGDHTWSAEFKPVGGGSFKWNGNFKINKEYTSISYNGSTSINLGVGESTELDVYVNPDEAGALSYSSSDASVASITKKENSNNTYIIEAKATGTATITFSCAGSKNYEAAEDKTITVTVSTPPIDVTINAAEEGATFTEASFLMPTYDVTAEYELVRDMSIQMTATMGDGTDGVRYRVKKSEQVPGKYEPAEMDIMQVVGLVAVNDGIEQKALTLEQDYFCRIYKLDEQTQQPADDGVLLADFDFAPGLYALKAFAEKGSNYDGETALSNTFKLFEGIPVVVPPTEEQGAGEEKVLGTLSYINNEFNLTLDANAGAKLYVITGVGTETATATEVTEVPKGKPFFVLNEEDTENNVTLLPVDDAQVTTTVTPAAEFLGTLVDKTFTADEMAADDYYVLQGGAFVFVKNAGTLAANHCYLKVEKNAAARRLKIVFGDEDTVTGIEGVKEVEGVEDDRLFDLNGRQLDSTPTRKGLYIRNGKKVVIR